MDLNKVEQSITNKTKAIIAVHLYGYPLDIESLMKLKNKYQISIIEDCSQAHGATFNGKKLDL